MNYYERHLGDYAKDTAHLSMLEHGAYGLLLDRYYATEEGIPEDQAHRVARARTKEEKQAVDAVLAEFFALDAGNWIHARCDSEIARFKESEPDRAAKRENEKERQRRSRERRKELFDSLRDNGIVPPFDTPMSELQTLLSRATKQPVTQPVTRDNTGTQTPDTRHQETLSPTALSGPTEKPVDPDLLPCPVEKIVEAYHEAMPLNPACKVLNDSRKRSIRQRWREASKMQAQPFGYSTQADGLAAWRRFFEVCAESDFLTGRVPGRNGAPSFLADVDFLFSPSGFAKCLENKYHREVA